MITETIKAIWNHRIRLGDIGWLYIGMFTIIFSLHMVHRWLDKRGVPK